MRINSTLVSVVIYSGKTSLVNSYCFVIDEGYGKCISAEKSFLLSGELHSGSQDMALRSAFFLSVPLEPRTFVGKYPHLYRNKTISETNFGKILL